MLQSFTQPSVGAFCSSVLLHLLAASALVVPAWNDNVFRLPKGGPTEVTLVPYTMGSASPALKKTTVQRPEKKMARAEVKRRADSLLVVDSLKQSMPEDAMPLSRSSPTVSIHGESQSEARGSTSGSDEATKSALSNYLLGLRERIEDGKLYPALSRRLGETGRVVLSFVVQSDGRITNLRVKSSSSHRRLDQAALDTVNSIKKYQPLPAEAMRDQLEVDVPVQFVF